MILIWHSGHPVNPWAGVSNNHFQLDLSLSAPILTQLPLQVSWGSHFHKRGPLQAPPSPSAGIISAEETQGAYMVLSAQDIETWDALGCPWIWNTISRFSTPSQPPHTLLSHPQLSLSLNSRLSPAAATLRDLSCFGKQKGPQGNNLGGHTQQSALHRFCFSKRCL